MIEYLHRKGLPVQYFILAKNYLKEKFDSQAAGLLEIYFPQKMAGIGQM